IPATSKSNLLARKAIARLLACPHRFSLSVAPPLVGCREKTQRCAKNQRSIKISNFLPWQLTRCWAL
ncbi:hypothetical protein, partial [Pantoea septica]|uniref:hypothetical protein n=1 Tax=Pantoea septica TaxID=472695 RepID=UPI00289A4C7E